ncbi:hypothetical protein [Allomesorhizobium alhagi]|uniref:hypothetical protein n=1 Tax=Allomesorhizobium alhagi TaxID=475067 RepID=UPI0002F44905|nr:hypothetical protein [Mesorhizobium alhagi]
MAAGIAGCKAEAAFAEKRREVLALFGAPDEDRTISGGNGGDYATARIFARLLALSDDDVMRALTIVMGETLEAGSAVIEALGNHLNVEIGAWWQPDDACFDLLRDKEIANAMLADIAGRQVADGNVAEKVKTQKKIIRDVLSGENGRQKADLAAALDEIPGRKLHRSRRPPHRRPVGTSSAVVRLGMSQSHRAAACRKPPLTSFPGRAGCTFRRLCTPRRATNPVAKLAAVSAR